MIKKFSVILLASLILMVIGCSSQSDAKTTKKKIVKEDAVKKENEYNDPSEFIYQINKNEDEQKVILNIESK